MGKRTKLGCFGCSLNGTFNAGLLALIINGDIEITGGQQTNFRESQAANIPTYSVKLLGRWVPYRFLPFIGELLAYGANYRDFARKNTTFMNQNVVGTAIVATAQTFLDAFTLLKVLSSNNDINLSLIEYAKIRTAKINWVKELSCLAGKAFSAKGTIAKIRNNLLLNNYLDLENFLNKIWEKDSPLNK